MEWNPKEAISYYKSLGAPKDQTALISLLREVQKNNGGSIPAYIPGLIAQVYGIKESFLLAIIKRIPSLRLCDQHLLEICAGPNCGRQKELAAFADTIHSLPGRKISLKFVPCMRMCGKGPNLKWDGKLYHNATVDLLKRLLAEDGIEF